MTRLSSAVLVAAALFVLPACGSGDGSTVTTVPPVTTTTPAPQIPANALFPAPGVVYDTPDAAARAFVEEVMGVPARLSAFRGGDSLSGEIEIGVEGASEDAVRGTILLRRAGPAAPWFIIGVVNDHATIASPEAGSTVPAGSITVTGVARGFEGLVHVFAVLADSPGTIVAEARTQAGSMEESLPYSVELDLSALSAGDRVILVVHGGVGLETDPGDTGALGIIIA
jgi:hypothetical protein